MKKLPIIYIAGAGRSGSSIIDRVLGSMPGVKSFAELRTTFRGGFERDLNCSCGNRVSKCAFWQGVRGDVMTDGRTLEEGLRLHKKFEFSRAFPILYAGRESAELKRYREYARALCWSVANRTGAEVMVDSSKVPTRALILNGIADFDVHVLHVVRDPRAVAFAWRKRMHNPTTDEERSTHSLAWTIRYWMMLNTLSGALKRRVPYTRIRYEDFAADPKRAIAEVASRIAPLNGREAAFVDERSVMLEPLHTVSGSPHRFQSGPTTLKLDEEWRSRMPTLHRKIVSAATYPLLSHYGYV